MTLAVGQKAPLLSLPDQDGKIKRLAGYKGEWVLVYFYPKDDTPGCTKEACGIKEYWNDFVKEGIIVLGISIDSVKSHKKFQEKYKLPHVLLSDETKKVVRLYGVWGKKKFMGREYEGTIRTSFLIDPNGKIVKIYKNVKPNLHAAGVLKDVERIKNHA